jgi:hypothetical protein
MLAVLATAGCDLDAARNPQKPEEKTVECIFNGEVLRHTAPEYHIDHSGTWMYRDGKLVVEYSAGVPCRRVFDQ